MALWNDTFAEYRLAEHLDRLLLGMDDHVVTRSSGIFIARISRGRTIRQFVMGVLAVPSAFSVVWFGIFGYASMDIEFNE